jgi:FkbM family methyltransferase
MFKMRPGTLDQYIFDQVFNFNEYSLPDRFQEADIVVDVGAHIGSFAYAALQRGAGRVYSIEADAENVEIATQNLQDFISQNRVRVVHGAAWRSDKNDDVLCFDGYPQMGRVTNTGGGRVLTSSDGSPVQKINFDAFVSDITSRGEGRVRFLKLDCEGSEWPILFTSNTLHLIDEIRGEIHEISKSATPENYPATHATKGPFDALRVEDLIELLTGRGFTVNYSPYFFEVPYFERLGILSAIRTDFAR